MLNTQPSTVAQLLPTWSLRISLARTTSPPPIGHGTFARVVGGPADLLAWLESQLGLHVNVDQCARMATLCAAMQRADSSGRLSSNIAKSFDNHPYAVASRMISHRDAFLMAVPLAVGGQPPPVIDIDGCDPSAIPSALPGIVREYVSTIAFATVQERSLIGTGEPDRLKAVYDAILDGQRLPACGIVIDDSLTEWPARWQSLLNALANANSSGNAMAQVNIQSVPAQACPRATAGSTLHVVQAALSPGFTSTAAPKANPDDSLRVARCASAAVASHAVAAALQGLSTAELADAVVICPDDDVAVMIDAHLHAFSLPTMGAGTSSQTSSILAVLPLAIEAVGTPADPGRVKEFLALPLSPIRRAAAARLLKALDNLPAVGSPAWTRVLRRIRTRWKGGAKTAASIDEWIPIPQKWCPSQVGLDAAALTAAVKRVSRWANRSYRRSKEGIRKSLAAGARTPADNAQLDLAVCRQTHFQALSSRCRAVLSLLEQRQLSGLVDRATVMQLLDAAHEGQATLAAHPACMGGPRRVRSLAEIGEFWGTVSRAVWVGPVRQSPPRVAWSQRDIAAMKSAHSIDLDFSAGFLDAMTRAEEAGLCHLAGSLLIITHPSADSSARPHPLWLLIAEMLRSGLPSPQPFSFEPPLLDSSKPQIPLSPWVIGRSPQVIQAEPAWVTNISLAPQTTMPPRPTVSHSDIERRLSCPVAWAFKYAADLSRPAGAAMPSPEISRGTVGEQILREVFGRRPTATVADAMARFDRIVRRRLPRLHASLCNPMAREAREEFESKLRQAVPVLQSLVDAGITITFGVRVDGFNSPAGSPIAWQGQSPRGAIDVLATAAAGSSQLPIVIDVKYGSADLHQKRLKQGNCTQLGLYADFVQHSNPAISVDSIGYLIITEGRLFVPAWAAGRLSMPNLSDVVQVVGSSTGRSLPQLISEINSRAAAFAALMHQPGAVLTAHPRAAAAGTAPHSDLAFVHGPDPAEAAANACVYCQYPLLCGKDRVR